MKRVLFNEIVSESERESLNEKEQTTRDGIEECVQMKPGQSAWELFVVDACKRVGEVSLAAETSNRSNVLERLDRQAVAALVVRVVRELRLQVGVGVRAAYKHACVKAYRYEDRYCYCELPIESKCDCDGEANAC